MGCNDSEPIRTQGIIIIVKYNVGTASRHRMFHIPCQKKLSPKQFHQNKFDPQLSLLEWRYKFGSYLHLL